MSTESSPNFFWGKMYIYAGKTRLLKAAFISISYSNILNYPASNVGWAKLLKTWNRCIFLCMACPPIYL